LPEHFEIGSIDQGVIELTSGFLAHLSALYGGGARMSRLSVQTALLLLQSFHVFFLLFHDWLPMGRLNDVRAMQAAHPRRLLIVGTLVSSLLPSIGLLVSFRNRDEAWPVWLTAYLAFTYVFLFVGEIEAWWAGYFFGYRIDRAISYRDMYGKTVAFLPERNGIRPNALHVTLHTATVATLVLLALWPLA